MPRRGGDTRGRGARARPPGASGITLVELLVTLAIIAILMSISLGVLSRFGKKDALEATTNGVRALLRRARNAAQEERWATVVEIDGEASELRARTRTTITRFNLDVAAAADDGDDRAPVGPGATTDTAPGEQVVDDDDEAAPFTVEGALGYELTVEGGELAEGRVGTGLLFEREGAWAWLEDRPALSPAEGIAIEAYVYTGVLEELLRARGERPEPSPTEALRRARAGEPPRRPSERLLDWRRKRADLPPLFCIARKGKAWSLSVTADYEVEVALTGPEGVRDPEGRIVGTGGDVTYLARTAPNTLRPERWQRVALVFDGDRCQVVVDGIPRVQAPLIGSEALPARLVRDPAPLCLSDPDPDASFYGVIDEVEVAAILDAQRLPIPLEVMLIAPDEGVGFDVLGQLDTARHPEPIVIYLTDDLRALDLVAPPAAAGGTQTRAEQARQRALAGQTPYRRFVAGLGTLDPLRWRAVVIERTGLVR